MDIRKVKEIMCNQNAGKNIFFTRKAATGYASYCPEVQDGILTEIIYIANQYLDNFIDLEQIEYNPTGYREDTIETCGIDYVGNYQDVIRSFDGGNVIGAEAEVDNLTFYCINVKNEENDIKLFRRVTKFKRLYSKGLLASFQGNRLNKVKDKMLGIDGNIDLIIFNDEIAILSHTSLERIFEVSAQFAIKANEALAHIKSSNKLMNFDSFEDDCLNDLKIQKILTKMLSEGNELDSCFDNFDNIIDTINLFDLDIEIQRAPQDAIVYENKRQIMDVLRLARDSYYRSLIRQKLGTDNKI